MRYHLHVRILLYFIILVIHSVCSAQTPDWLFCFFKGNGEDGMHLAYSEDGTSFKSLNGDRSLIRPEIGVDRLMRDPSIVRGPDNLFHLVWTSGWNDRCIGYAESSDLIHWSDQDSIFVMKNEPTAKNCWAPEIFYDDATEQYIIIWSTTIPGKFPETQTTCDGGNNHRLYYVTSKDCRTFSETKLFYNPGFNCIDGFLAKDGKRYVLVLKNETCSPAAKNFRIAFADSLTGPYGNLTGVLSTGADWVEGPSLIKNGSQWMLYYDVYGKGRYGIRKSTDLTSWQPGTDNMPKPNDARHGTVFPVTGCIIDPSEGAGFRWETTTASSISADNHLPLPALRYAGGRLVVHGGNEQFRKVRIYSCDGRLLQVHSGASVDGRPQTIPLKVKSPWNTLIVEAEGAGKQVQRIIIR